MVHKLVNIIQSFKSQSLCNMHFYGLRGRHTQGPPRAAHILATPLVTCSFVFNVDFVVTIHILPSLSNMEVGAGECSWTAVFIIMSLDWSNPSTRQYMRFVSCTLLFPSFATFSSLPWSIPTWIKEWIRQASSFQMTQVVHFQSPLRHVRSVQVKSDQ